MRRFENDNLFGLSLILGKNLEIDGEDPGIVPTDLVDSNFVDIMDTRNRDALDYYLSCADYGHCRDEKRTRKKRTIAYEVVINHYSKTIALFTRMIFYTTGLDEC